MQPMQKRKYLFYTYALVDGGAERVWATIASEFARRGHDVTFVIDYDAGIEPLELHPAVHRVTLGGSHVTTVRRLSALLQTLRPDVAFGAVAGSDLKLVLARVLARVPTRLIISYHGLLEHKTGWLSWLTHITVPVLSRVADRTVCVSEGLKRILIQRWHSAPAYTVCVHNPVVVPDAASGASRDDLQRRPNAIVAVGRLVPEKGFDLLIRAMSRLQAADATLTILGEGPERPRLEALIRDLKLEQRVTLAGFQRDIWSYLDRAKCFAHAAYSEAFGLVIAEALARGLPVVAVASDGPGEIINDAALGVIVPIGDVPALVVAIDAALMHPGDPVPRVARAAEFSLARGVNAYQKLADVVLAGRRTTDAASAKVSTAT